MEHVYDAWDMTDPRATVINRCSRNLVLHSTGAKTNALCHRDVFVSAVSKFPSDNQASATALYSAVQNRPQKTSGAKHFAKSLHWALQGIFFSISVCSKTTPWHWAGWENALTRRRTGLLITVLVVRIPLLTDPPTPMLDCTFNECHESHDEEWQWWDSPSDEEAREARRVITRFGRNSL